MSRRADPTAIERLDALDEAGCAAMLAALFEGAPRFLARLCAARPFGSAEVLFARARAIARAMPEAEQLELVDAHPRLGAPPGSISAHSFLEQGYDREAAGMAADEADAWIARKLDRLNAEYETRFGFRYCVFVAGRPRSALLPDLEASLAADRGAELRRAIEAVVDIAADRYRRSLTGG